MDFSMIQSIGTYTKNMEMQMKWQKKKEDNDFTADGSTNWSDPTARQAEEIRRSQADGSAKLLSQIRTKLAAGKKLTQEEMDYLQKNDLPTYQKVKAIEAEQKSYEKELKNCKTKEDVQRVRTNRVAASLSVVNNVKNNPAIPEGAKLGLIWQELQKNMPSFLRKQKSWRQRRSLRSGKRPSLESGMRRKMPGRKSRRKM